MSTRPDSASAPDASVLSGNIVPIGDERVTAAPAALPGDRVSRPATESKAGQTGLVQPRGRLAGAAATEAIESDAGSIDPPTGGRTPGQAKRSGVVAEQSDRPAGYSTGARSDAETARSSPTRLSLPGPSRRHQLSAFLAKTAMEAFKQDKWRDAIPLYQALVAARGPGCSEALELAQSWANVGQYRQAVSILDAFISATADRIDSRPTAPARDSAASHPTPGGPAGAAELELARSKRDEWGRIGEPTRGFVPARLTRRARQAFRFGRSALRKRHYADARVYFEMGHALDPELPGFVRELGTIYDKLGLAEKKISLFHDYLRARPFGKNADAIRRALGKRALGHLAIESSLPCDELWLNRQRVPAKVSISALRVAPGEYRALCVSYRYEIAYFEYAVVEPDRPSAVRFRWAIIVNQLTQPYGRITIENPRAPGVMMDLGISQPEVGVIVPEDGRSLGMVLRDDASTRVEERTISLEPGRRYVIKW